MPRPQPNIIYNEYNGLARRGEHCSPAAATPVNQPDGQTARASTARPYTQRDNSNKLLVARRGGVTPPYGAIKIIAPRFYGKTKTRRPLPRLVFHKKKEKNRTSCRFLQRNGTHPSTSRCPSFRPGRALWYSSSLSNHGDVFCPRVIFRCLHSTRFLSELQEVAVYNVL